MEGRRTGVELLSGESAEGFYYDGPFLQLAGAAAIEQYLVGDGPGER